MLAGNPAVDEPPHEAQGGGAVTAAMEAIVGSHKHPAVLAHESDPASIGRGVTAPPSQVLEGRCQLAAAVRARRTQVDGDEMEVIGGFEQELKDWMDIWQDIGPVSHAEASRHLGERLVEIRDMGWSVYGRLSTVLRLLWDGKKGWRKPNTKGKGFLLCSVMQMSATSREIGA